MSGNPLLLELRDIVTYMETKGLDARVVLQLQQTIQALLTDQDKEVEVFEEKPVILYDEMLAGDDS